MGKRRFIFWWCLFSIVYCFGIKSSYASEALIVNATNHVMVGPFVDSNGDPMWGLDVTTLKCRYARGTYSATLTISDVSGYHNSLIDEYWGMYSFTFKDIDLDQTGNVTLWFYHDNILVDWQKYEVVTSAEYYARLGEDYRQVDVLAVNNSAVTSVNDFKADVSGLSTFDHTTDQVTVTGTVNADIESVNEIAITNINDFKADVSVLEGRLTAARAGYLDKLNVTGTLANTDNADSFKADTTGLSTFNATTDLVSADIESVNGFAVTSVNDFKADVSGLATQLVVGGWIASVSAEAAEDDVNVTHVAGLPVSGINDFKADVSGLSTFNNTTDQVIVGSIQTPALAQFITVDTGETMATTGSVASIAQGEGSITSLTAGDLTNIKREVWSANIINFVTPGTTAEALNKAKVSNSLSVDAIWSATPEHYPTNSTGNRLAHLGSANVIVSSPVATGGNIEIYKGDDYDFDEGTGLIFTNNSTSSSVLPWPNLTGATVRLSIGDKITNVAGVVSSPTPPIQTVVFDLTNVQTSTLTSPSYSYSVVATLASGNVKTLAVGRVTVKTR